MARHLSRAEFSRLAGVSDTAISKSCKSKLKEACDGDRIDIDHPAALAYLKSKGKKPPPVSRKKPVASEPAPPDSPRSAEAVLKFVMPGSDEDLDQLSEVLTPLVDRFGTRLDFKDFLAALKTIEEIRGKRLDNEETEGRLIERELVSAHIFSALENFHKRLLTDVVTTISQRLYGAAKGGVPLEEAKRIVRGIISEQLKPVKTTAARVLRNA